VRSAFSGCRLTLRMCRMPQKLRLSGTTIETESKRGKFLQPGESISLSYRFTIDAITVSVLAEICCDMISIRLVGKVFFAPYKQIALIQQYPLK
jgi:hypothetical protein